MDFEPNQYLISCKCTTTGKIPNTVTLIVCQDYCSTEALAELESIVLLELLGQ